MENQYEKANRRHSSVFLLLQKAVTDDSTIIISNALRWSLVDAYRITGNDINLERLEIMTRIALNCLSDERKGNIDLTTN
jgi:hypothetical protein